MATTYNFIGLDNTSETVVFVKEIDRTKFVLADRPVKPNGGREAVYVRTDGDPTLPATIRQGYYPKSNGNPGAGTSAKFTFPVQKLEDGVVVETKLGSVTISTDMPWGSIPNVTHMAWAIWNMATWMMPVLEGTDSYDSSELSKLQFGVVDDMLTETAG